MTVVRLHASKAMVGLNIFVHLLAVAAVWLSNLPVMHSILMSALVLISLFFQWRIIGMARPDSIVALELHGEDCQPVFRDAQFQKCGPRWQLAGRAYSSSLLQVMYFEPKKAGSVATGNPVNIIKSVVQSRVGSRSLCILRDSCASEDWRQLRKFLRWRVCF